MDDESFDSKMGQEYLERLKSIREQVNWEIEEEREYFYRQFCSLINDWKSRLPDLREIFRREEIDWLLTKCVKIGRTELIKFVIRTGYKDEPDLDDDGKPLLCRNTPVNYAAEHKVPDWVSKVCELFKIYDKFNVNYTNETGFTHFHAACMSGCDDIVEKFLELGQDPNLPMKEIGDTPLHLAIHYECAKVVELLLKSGGNPNLAKKGGLTCLHYIALPSEVADDDLAEKFFQIIDEIQLTLEVNAQDNYGSTPLHFAAHNGKKRMIECLLRRGADPNSADAKGFTSLHHIAISGSDNDLMEKFFEICDDMQQTVQVDAIDKLGNTPLHVALREGNLKLAESLLRRGVDPNLADFKGSTSLHIIVRQTTDYDLLEKFFEICSEIQRTLKVDALDKKGQTPLHLAIGMVKENMVKSLLKNGADPNLADAEGLTSLHLIALRQRDDEVMEWFFEICNDMNLIVQVDVRNSVGETPLHWAVAFGNQRIVECLLRNGIDPNLTDAYGFTSLHRIALRYSDDDLAEKFFEICNDMNLMVQIDAQNKWGRTPLHIASYIGGPKKVEALLRRGADINLADKEGMTALHFFCIGRYDNDLVKTFFKINDDLQQTVQIDARDKWGRTPLQTAVANLLPTVIDVLLERGPDLSSFVFPTESYFCEMFDEINLHWDKLRLASGILAVVERLEDREYDLSRSEVLTIIKLFVKYELFEQSSDLEKCWYDEEEFTSRAKEIIIIPNLSLYDLMLLPSEKEDKLLTYMDYFKVKRYENLYKIPKQYRDKCLRHLCEKMSRGYVQRLALDSLLDLTRLPILCCEKIIKKLEIEDLLRIYEAGEIVTKGNGAKTSDTVSKGNKVEKL